MVNHRIMEAVRKVEAALEELRDAIGDRRAASKRGRGTLDQAAALAKKHPDTMKEYAERYGLGEKIGGRWSFDLDLVATFFKIES